MEFKSSKAKILQSSELASPLGGDGTEQPGDKAQLSQPPGSGVLRLPRESSLAPALLSLASHASAASYNMSTLENTDFHLPSLKEI